MPMTKAEYEALTDHDRGAIVCQSFDIPGRIVWMLTTDGGASAFYTSDYRKDCEELLDDIRRRRPESWQAKGEVKSTVHYPPVTTDTSAALTVLRQVLQSDHRPEFAAAVVKLAGLPEDASAQENAVNLMDWILNPDNICNAALIAVGAITEG